MISGTNLTLLTKNLHILTDLKVTGKGKHTSHCYPLPASLCLSATHTKLKRRAQAHCTVNTSQAEVSRAVMGQNPPRRIGPPTNSSLTPQALTRWPETSLCLLKTTMYTYLSDIDFHLHTVPNATAWDALYLLRIRPRVFPSP